MLDKDIKFLLVFLIIALATLVWLQNQQCNAIPNQGALNVPSNGSSKPMSGSAKVNGNEVSTNGSNGSSSSNGAKRSNGESQMVASKIVDNILKEERAASKVDRIMNQDMSSQVSADFTNPIIENVNNDRNSMSSDQNALEELIRDVNTGNDLLINSPQAQLYRQKAKSIDAAPPGQYRNVSYKDSQYRYDFDNDGSPSQASQDELNSLYDDALVFRNNEYTQNTNFTGFNETPGEYGSANLKDFTPKGKQTQQEKVMALYNSNEYLPNNDLLDTKLTKGFQILENPVAVSNPNLIPVLKSIPVSSVLGSKRNSTYDIRSEPPNPKTVVSPFLNSSIMPDIYATQRGCL